MKNVIKKVACALVLLNACASPEEMVENNNNESTITALSNNTPYSINGQILQAKAGTDPGGVIFQNKAYFTFVRTDGRIGIIAENNLGNYSGQGASSIALTDTTNYGASLSVFNNKLHLVYVGTNRKIYMRRSVNGSTWDGPYLVNDYDSHEYTPAVTSYGGNLHVFVSFAESCVPVLGCIKGMIHYVIADTTGVRTVGLGEKTNDSPTAINWNGRLYLSWAGTSDNKPIYIKSMDIAGNWSSPTIVTSNWGRPAFLASNDGSLGIIYRGNNQGIYRVNTYDGAYFLPPAQLGGSTTDHQPVPFINPSGSTWVYYVGVNNKLYTAIF